MARGRSNKKCWMSSSSSMANLWPARRAPRLPQRLRRNADGPSRVVEGKGELTLLVRQPLDPRHAAGSAVGPGAAGDGRRDFRTAPHRGVDRVLWSSRSSA